MSLPAFSSYVQLSSVGVATDRFVAAGNSRCGSSIRDVDVAQETALLVRDQVVQQAAIPVLALARLAPAPALLLLG